MSRHKTGTTTTAKLQLIYQKPSLARELFESIRPRPIK